MISCKHRKLVSQFSISNDLFISIAQGHHKSFPTQFALANYYLEKNIIQDQNLHKAFSLVDRAFFTDDKENLYGSFSNKLNKRDNMTTPYMHIQPAIQLSELKEQESLIVYDVGCGSGYFAILSNLYLQYCGVTRYKVYGLEIDEKMTEQCKTIQESQKDKLQIQQEVIFESTNILDIQSLDFDFMNIGFGIGLQHLYHLQAIMQDKQAQIICPLQDGLSPEQWLSSIKISKNDLQIQKLMRCYFQQIKTKKNNDSQVLQDFKLKESEIEVFVKNWNNQFFETNRMKASLNDMKNNAQLMQKLEELRKIKRKIKILEQL